MKVERIALRPVCYRLRRPIRSGSTLLQERVGLRVRIEGPDGHAGWGEALPLPSSGTESAEACERRLHSLANQLEGRTSTLDELLDHIEEEAPFEPAARFAFDCAFHDLASRIQGKSVARFLGAQPPVEVRVNAVVGIATTQDTIAAVLSAQKAGYETLKLKVGAASLDEDFERVLAVRKAVGPELSLRLDANGSWKLSSALAFLDHASTLELEFVEQPVPAYDLAGLEQAHSVSPVPIAADESLSLQEARIALVEGRLARFAILKPMVLGGLRACLRLAQDARKAGVESVVTTTFEGNIGTAAATHLASVLCERACGLASCDALEGEFPSELVPKTGLVTVEDADGLGVKPGP